jgi:hypothetical protein
MKIICIDSEIKDKKLQQSVKVSNYSSIIFNKESLYQRLKRSLDDRFNLIINNSSNISEDEVHIKWSSNIVYKDLDAQKLFLDKLINCAVPFLWGDKNSYIFKGTNKEFINFKNYQNKLDDLFIQINDIGSFHNLVEINFDTRFFNKIYNTDEEYIKKSTNKKKLKDEYDFLCSIPTELKNYYVPVNSYNDHINESSYRMPKVNFLDISKRYINGGISEDDASTLIRSIQIYQNKVQELTKKNIGNEFSFIYQKTSTRIEQFKTMKIYNKLNIMLSNYTKYKKIDESFDKLLNLLSANKTNINNAGSILSHGDLCFSNILASEHFDKLLLIDPMGGIGDNAFKSIYYDFAKLSHSIHGNYDYIINNIAYLDFTSDMNLELNYHQNSNLFLTKKFEEMVTEFKLDLKILRLIEASLFLSMLPLHSEDERRVNMLAIRGIEILDNL